MGTGEEKKIGNISSVFLLTVAGLFDGLQYVLTVLLIGIVFNPFVSIFAWLTFFVWFKMLGVSFLDGAVRKAIVFCGGMFSELIPIFNTLPMIVTTVGVTIAIIRLEDKARKVTGKDIHIADAIKNS